MATALTLSAPVGYVGTAVQPNGPFVGVNANQRQVMRYSFTTPANGIVTSLTFNTTFRYLDSGGANNTYYVRFKVTEDSESYINAGSGYAYDGSVSLQGAYDVAKSCTIAGLALSPNKTYYLWLFPGEDYYFVRFCYDNNGKDVSTLTAEVAAGYRLTISAGTGSTITVNRISSVSGATGAIPDGGTVYAGDVLKISFGVSEGYNLGSHTVNNSTFTSGGTHTVTGAVAVRSTATVKSFKLTITRGEGTTVTVTRTDSPKGGASTGELSDGATLYYSDVLVLTFAAADGFEKPRATINGTAKDSGSSHTVTGAVTVVTAAEKKTPESCVFIGGVAYDVYVGDGEAWIPYDVYVGNGTSWDLCG